MVQKYIKDGAVVNVRSKPIKRKRTGEADDEKDNQTEQDEDAAVEEPDASEADEDAPDEDPNEDEEDGDPADRFIEALKAKKRDVRQKKKIYKKAKHEYEEMKSGIGHDQSVEAHSQSAPLVSLSDLDQENGQNRNHNIRSIFNVDDTSIMEVD